MNGRHTPRSNPHFGFLIIQNREYHALRAIFRIDNYSTRIDCLIFHCHFLFVFHSKLPVRDGQESNLERSTFLILKHVLMYFTPSVEKLFGKETV